MAKKDYENRKMQRNLIDKKDFKEFAQNNPYALEVYNSVYVE